MDCRAPTKYATNRIKNDLCGIRSVFSSQESLAFKTGWATCSHWAQNENAPTGVLDRCWQVCEQGCHEWFIKKPKNLAVDYSAWRSTLKRSKRENRWSVLMTNRPWVGTSHKRRKSCKHTCPWYSVWNLLAGIAKTMTKTSFFPFQSVGVILSSSDRMQTIK